MKATRNRTAQDDLGRVVIPKEIRCTMARRLKSTRTDGGVIQKVFLGGVSGVRRPAV